jgi:hypothetical protein
MCRVHLPCWHGCLHQTPPTRRGLRTLPSCTQPMHRTSPERQSCIKSTTRTYCLSIAPHAHKVLLCRQAHTYRTNLSTHVLLMLLTELLVADIKVSTCTPACHGAQCIHGTPAKTVCQSISTAQGWRWLPMELPARPQLTNLLVQQQIKPSTWLAEHPDSTESRI